VIPVPIISDLSVVAAQLKPRSRPVEIVWNHRWEYDKQPQVFFAAIEKLIEDGRELTVHVMGQSFREVPDCFTDFRNSHAQYVATWGHQSVDAYRQVLQNADIVVSAALHDFQGLGMLEAIAAGCIPVAPDRMAYPEYMPADLLYSTQSNDHNSEHREVLALYQKLVQIYEGDIQHSILKNIDLSGYIAIEVLPKYRQLFTSLISSPNA